MEQFREQTRAFLIEKIAQVEATKKVDLQARQKEYFATEIQPQIAELVEKKNMAINDVRKNADVKVAAIEEATQKAVEELTAKSGATVEAMFGGEYDKEIALYRKIIAEIGE